MIFNDTNYDQSSNKVDISYFKLSYDPKLTQTHVMETLTEKWSIYRKGHNHLI